MSYTRTVCLLFLITVCLIGTGCQPLSTKRSQAAKTKASVPTKGEIAKSDEDAPPLNAAAQDSTYTRRKLPTLREQLDRLQHQQDLTNTKIDSLQMDVGALRREIQNLRADMQASTPSSKPSAKQPITKGDVPRKESAKAQPAEEEPARLSEQPKSKKKEDARLIMPDSMTEPELPTSEQQNTKAPVKKKVKREPENDVIMPDNELEAQPKKKKLSPAAPSESPAKKKNPGVLVQSSPPASGVQNKAPNTSKAKTDAAGEAKPSAVNTNAGAKSDEANPTMNAAMKLFVQRKFQEAYNLFEEVASTEKKPDASAQAYYWMGESKYGMAKYDDAIRNFEKVIQLKSKDKSPAAMILIAESQAKKGNTAEAKKMYRQVQKQYPKTIEAAQAEKRLQQL